VQAVAVAEILFSMDSGASVPSAFSICTLFIPLCGWAGARQQSARLLKVFTGCNVVCASIVALGAMMNLITVIPTIACICDDECFVREYTPGGRDSPESLEIWTKRESACAPGKDHLLEGLWATTAIAVVLCTVELAAAFYARKLTFAMVFATDILGAIPVATVIDVPVQPGVLFAQRGILASASSIHATHTQPAEP
jgi:hypothetical protein